MCGSNDVTIDNTTHKADVVVDYIVTGSWSDAAAKEASKYVNNVNIVCNSKSNNYTDIVDTTEWKYSSNPSYIYYCHNETVHGIEFNDIPYIPDNLKHVPLVCDMSSCFMSQSVDISRYGIIYAGAQKNVGPSGVTIVIIRNDLLNRTMPICPTVLNYSIFADKQSLYNTPPSYSIYITNYVFKWLQQQGGLDSVYNNNKHKSQLLYDYIDNSKYYVAKVSRSCRSIMNVNFDIKQHDNHDTLLKQLIKEAEQQYDIIGIGGHRSVGGLRASLYNAVTIDSVKALIQFLQQFADKHPKQQ